MNVVQPEAKLTVSTRQIKIKRLTPFQIPFIMFSDLNHWQINIRSCCVRWFESKHLRQPHHPSPHSQQDGDGGTNPIYMLTINLLIFFNFKWSNFGTVHHHFKGYQDENLKLDIEQYRAWLDCTDVQVGLAIYWWQRLVTFAFSRIRVKYGWPMFDSCRKTSFLKALFTTSKVLAWSKFSQFTFFTPMPLYSDIWVNMVVFKHTVPGFICRHFNY